MQSALSLALYGLAGGYADGLGFIISGSFTGHITGNLVLLVISATKVDWMSSLHPLIAIAFFLAATDLGIRISAMGDARSGWLLPSVQTFLLLLTALPHAQRGSLHGLMLSGIFAVVLGLQNGIITREFGLTVHSTYMSGNATRMLQSGGQSALPSKHDIPVVGLASSGFVSSSAIVSFLCGVFLAVLANRYGRHWAPLLLCLPLILASLLRQPSSEMDALHGIR